MNTVGKFPRILVSEKTVQLNRKFFYTIIIISLCFLLDRFSKIYIIKLFINNGFKDYFINEFLNFTLIWNRGIAFGLLQSENFTYHFISILIFLIIIFILYIIIKSNKFAEIFSYSMIAGGALGNLFDRIYYNAVADFIDLNYKNFHWFTFNVADIFISVGIVLLLTFDIFNFKNREKNE